MPSSRRRRFLSALAAAAAVPAAGCSALQGRSPPERRPDSNPVRELDPVRTEGDPVRVGRTEMEDREPPEVLRVAVSERSDCFREEIPVEPHGPGLLVTTVSVVESTGEANVYFPSPSYRTLAEICPRSIIVTSPAGTPTPAAVIPVHVRAILRRGDREGTTPEMAPDC